MQHSELLVTQQLTPMILQLQRKDGRSTEKRGHPRRYASTCEEVCPSPSSAFAHSTGCQRPLTDPCGGADAIGGTCVDREPLPAARRWRLAHVGERAVLVLCHEDMKMKAKEDGVRAATAVATRFWTLPLSQCPGCPRVNTLRTLISARSAPRSRCLPSDKYSSNPSGALRRFTTRTTALARHKVPRGGAVSGAASAALRHVG